MSDAAAFVPGSVVYDRTLAAKYETARALSSGTAQAWREAIRPYLPTKTSWTVVDLGAGTGRFSDLWAEFPGARVVSVEPSRDMLMSAARRDQRRGVSYVNGTGEQTPLVDGSCDVVWLSHVFHHLRDRARCVRELRRIVRPRGRVLVRGTFGDSLDGYATLFQFFPGARRICAGLPTISDAVSLLAGERFALEERRPIAQPTWSSLRDFADRTRRRADSALILLSDREFFAGLAAVDEAAAAEGDPRPVVETVDLLVFRAPTSVDE